MRTKLIYPVLLTLALVLAGCSVGLDLPNQVQRGVGLTSPSASASGAASTTPSPTTAAAGSTTTSTATSSSTSGSQTTVSSNDPVYAAIQSVIQRANQEQQDAFTKGDPTIMKDTATSDYYNQMAQINQEMAANGVSAIKLVKIEWGPITLSNATTAQATTYETWQTAYSDGSTDQSRDENVYTLVKEQDGWKIQSDEQPDSHLNIPPGPASPTPSGPTPPITRVLPGQAGVSQNWSGYAADSGTFTGVTGTWTVPQSNGTGGFSSGAAWVGIGGVRSRDLIQAGTEETSSQAGRIRFDAWIETLPQPSHPVQLAVNPGDSVTVSIAQQGTDQWLISMQNNTTGQSYKTTVQYSSSLSSAEWVMEAPSAGRRILPLDDFGTLQFSGGSAIKDGKTVTIAQSGAQAITMIDTRGVALAAPSPLTSDGSGFSISRTAAAPAVPSIGGGGFGSPFQGRGSRSRSTYGVAQFAQLPGYAPAGQTTPGEATYTVMLDLVRPDSTQD